GASSPRPPPPPGTWSTSWWTGPGRPRPRPSAWASRAPGANSPRPWPTGPRRGRSGPRGGRGSSRRRPSSDLHPEFHVHVHLRVCAADQPAPYARARKGRIPRPRGGTQMTNDNVISLPSAASATIPEPPPMTPPPGLLVPGPGGEDDTNTGSREEMPWDGEQGPAEDELVTPPVSDPKNPTPAEVLATLLALCTALGVAGLRRLWLAYSARKGSAGGRDRGGSGGRGGGSGWSRRTTGRPTTGPRTPGASPTGRGGSKTSGAATGRDRGGRDRSPSRSRDHDRSHRSRDRDRSGRRYRAGERPVAPIVRREIDAARRRADNKRGDGAD